MAPHSSTLDWKIPWMEEPGRLQSMGSQRVGHDRVTKLKVTQLYIHIHIYTFFFIFFSFVVYHRILGWMKHKLESRLPGEISITSVMQMTPPLWQKVKN